MTRREPDGSSRRSVPLDYFAEVLPAGEPRPIDSSDYIPALVIVAAPYVLALLLVLAGS